MARSVRKEKGLEPRYRVLTSATRPDVLRSVCRDSARLGSGGPTTWYGIASVVLDGVFPEKLSELDYTEHYHSSIGEADDGASRETKNLILL